MEIINKIFYSKLLGSKMPPPPDHPDFIQIWDKNKISYLAIGFIMTVLVSGMAFFILFTEIQTQLTGKTIIARPYSQTSAYGGYNGYGSLVKRIHFTYFENGEAKTGSVRWILFTKTPSKGQKIEVIKGKKDEFVVENISDLIFIFVVGVYTMLLGIKHFYVYFIYKKMKAA